MLLVNKKFLFVTVLVLHSSVSSPVMPPKVFREQERNSKIKT